MEINMKYTLMVKVVNPLKQGLKLTGRYMELPDGTEC